MLDLFYFSCFLFVFCTLLSLLSIQFIFMPFQTSDILQENSDKSVIELQQYAKKNKPNLHILNKLQEEMRKLATQRVRLIAERTCFMWFQRWFHTCLTDLLERIYFFLTFCPIFKISSSHSAFFLFLCFFLQEETRKKPKMTIMESAQPGSEPLCTVDV